MKNTIKNTVYVAVGASLLALNTVNAVDVKWTLGQTAWDHGTGGDFIWTLDNMLGFLIWLLYFIAIIFALYGWFQILTAAWDEEKVKKWKNTLIHAVIWLVVIFLASIIVNWIIWLSATVIR